VKGQVSHFFEMVLGRPGSLQTSRHVAALANIALLRIVPCVANAPIPSQQLIDCLRIRPDSPSSAQYFLACRLTSCVRQRKYLFRAGRIKLIRTGILLTIRYRSADGSVDLIKSDILFRIP